MTATIALKSKEAPFGFGYSPCSHITPSIKEESMRPLIDSNKKKEIHPVPITSLSERIDKAVENFGEFWAYVANTMSALRYSLCAYQSTLSPESITKELVDTINYLRIGLAVGLLLQIKSLPEQLKNAWNSKRIKDTEGVALGCLRIGTTISDVIDDIVVVTQAVAAVASIAIAPFSVLFGMCYIFTQGGRITNQGYNIYNSKAFLDDLAEVIPDELDASIAVNKKALAVQEFAKKFFTLSEKEKQLTREEQADLLERKKIILVRQTSARVAEELEEIATIEITDASALSLINRVTYIKNEVNLEINFNKTYLFSNLISLSGHLILFVPTVIMLTVPGGFIPYMCLAIGVSIRLGMLVYTKHYLIVLEEKRADDKESLKKILDPAKPALPPPATKKDKLPENAGS